MLEIRISRSEPLMPLLRKMVEDGCEDQPAEVYYDGKRCLLLGSLHDAACVIPVGAQFHVWNPGPKDVVGPRMAAALAGYRARLQARAAAREEARRARRAAADAQP